MDRLASIVAGRYMTREALGQGDTFETQGWRIHRFADHINITDLTNAGKRGKKVVTWIIMGRTLPFESLALGYVMWAKRNATPAEMKKAIDEDQEAFGPSMKVEDRIERGIDVAPGGFKPVLIRGAMVTIESDYEGFSIKDINDDANEPTCIARGKKSVKQFYRWCQDNARKLQAMSLSDIMNALSKEGIEYHYYCAID